MLSPPCFKISLGILSGLGDLPFLRVMIALRISDSSIGSESSLIFILFGFSSFILFVLVLLVKSPVANFPLPN